MFFSVHPLFFFPPHNLLISADEINHSNLSTHVLHISIFSSSCLPRNATSFVIASKSPHSLLYLSNLSSVSFCNTKTVTPKLKSIYFLTHRLIPSPTLSSII